MHSPFVYKFINEIKNDQRSFYAFNQIEDLKRKLEKDERIIEVLDLGAGSKKMSNKRKVKDIAKNAGITHKKGALMFRLINQYKATNIIEIGTSLGLGTAYLAAANPEATITTFEGCPETLSIAKENLSGLGFENIQFIEGNFNDTLKPFVQKQDKVDFIFFDGNHTEKGTLDYFEICLEKVHEQSVFVFDDINWSDGMISAWKKIEKHPKVTVGMNLFKVGLTFFHTGQAKQNFMIYF